MHVFVLLSLLGGVCATSEHRILKKIKVKSCLWLPNKWKISLW